MLVLLRIFANSDAILSRTVVFPHWRPPKRRDDPRSKADVVISLHKSPLPKHNSGRGRLAANVLGGEGIVLLYPPCQQRHRHRDFVVLMSDYLVTGQVPKACRTSTDSPHILER